VVYARYRPRSQGAAAPAVRAAPTGPADRRFRFDGAPLESLLTVIAQGLEAGLPLTSVLGGPVAAGLPAQLARALLEDARASQPLSRTLGRISSLDPGSHALVAAGERHGRLPEALREVAARLAERRKDRSRLLLALAYPSFLFVAGALLMPLPKLIRSGLGAYLASVVPMLAGVALLAFLVLGVLPRLPADSRIRHGLRSLGCALPLIGGGLWAGALATFADVLGACLRAGLPAAESLRLALRAGDHPRLEAAGPFVLGSLEAGSTLVTALGAIPGLDHGFSAQVGAGELSGTLDRVLPSLATEWRRRARVRALVAVGVAGALALVAVVGALAFEVISSWKGYFEGQNVGYDALMRE
jgi:general secretion pathway protein F